MLKAFFILLYIIIFVKYHMTALSYQSITLNYI